jgi:hypothetical protein
MSDIAISALPTASALAGGEVIAGVQAGATKKFPESFWQRSDAELSALAGLVSAADKFPYFTGSGTASMLTIVSAIRTLLASADVATFRSNAGLAIGTNVQAYDADLATIAGLTATTDNFIVSVSNAWASRTPAQVRTTLGVAPLPTTTGLGKWYQIASGNNTALVAPNVGTTWAYITFFRLTSTDITYYGIYASGIIAANTQILPAEPTANLICFLYQVV